MAGVTATVSTGCDEAAIGTEVLAGRLANQTTNTISTTMATQSNKNEGRIFIDC
jgi:hypothetical protein